MQVQRIQLDMSLSIAERFLDRNNADEVEQRLQAILGANPVDFYYEMPEEDKAKLPAATVGLILMLADEYTDILEIMSSELFDGGVDMLSIIARGENVIARLEQVRRIAEAEIEHASEEEANAQEAAAPDVPQNPTNEEIEQQQQEPASTIEQLIATQFNDQLNQLNTIKDDIVNKKYDTPEGFVGGDAVTAANQLIANIQALIDQYPNSFTPQQKDDFGFLLQFFTDFAVAPAEPNVVNEIAVEQVQQDWKSLTTTWKATFEDSVGIEDSKAVDGSKLLDVTGDPEFITDAVFELTMKRTRGARGGSVDRVHVIVHYKGKSYSPVAVATGNTPQGRAFYNAVRLAVANNPGKRIIISNKAVGRSNGRIKVVERGSLVEQGIINDSNFYEITYNSTQTKFGVTKKTTDPISGTPITLVQAPGESATQKRTLYSWVGPNVPEAGALVMMVEPV